MAFVLTVPPAWDFDTELFEHGDERAGLIKVGYDNRTEVTYTVYVGLSPAVMYWPDGYELFFRIMTYDPRDRTTSEFNDGLDSRYAIPRSQDRMTISEVIASFSCGIVSTVMPELVFVQTRMALPNKALVKYAMVLHSIATLGYHIKPEQPFHGQQSWKLERNP